MLYILIRVLVVLRLNCKLHSSQLSPLAMLSGSGKQRQKEEKLEALAMQLESTEPTYKNL